MQLLDALEIDFLHVEFKTIATNADFYLIYDELSPDQGKQSLFKEKLIDTLYEQLEILNISND